MRLSLGLLEGTRRGTRIALGVVLAYVLLAVFARWVAPQPVQDLRSLDLMNASLPPAWQPEGNRAFLLGTDEQGRDVLSGVLFGLRLSMGVGFAAVALAMAIGLAAGLVSGYRGGWLDALLMRAADAQLTFPAILVAMLLDGVARSVLPRSVHETLGVPVVVGAIALAQWVPFARAARVGTLVEREKGYVQAAQVMARPDWAILLGHVLPNVLGPIVVIATIGLGNAILTEATLSFLGVGIPPTSPSLGTLVRNGSAYLPSGAWWMVVFPGLALAGLVLAVNVAGDGLRDGLDPKQRSAVS